MNKSLFLTLTLCFIAGCSQQPKKPANKATFTTHITADGVKKFQYSQTQGSKGNKKRGEKGSKGGGKGNRSGGSGGKGRDARGSQAKRKGGGNKNNVERMKRQVEDKLNETGYCREGFAEIDHYTDAGKFYFNGQCNERASIEDRRKFK